MYTTLTLFIFISNYAHAAELATGMSGDEVEEAGEIFALSAMHKAWTAHSIQHETGLGVELGFESSFVYRGDVKDFGNQNAVVTKVVPIPRIWLGVNYTEYFFFSASAAPGSLIDGISNYGLSGQWTMYRDLMRGLYYSLMFHMNVNDAFDGDLKSTGGGFLAQVSKDVIFWQAYFGLGFVTAELDAADEIVAAGVDTDFSIGAFHAVAGVRIDYGAKFNVQLEFVGSNPVVSLMISRDL